MGENVIGTIAAGSTPEWEVVQEDEDRPYKITIRRVDNHADKITMPRSAIPVLIDILGRVPPSPD